MTKDELKEAISKLPDLQENLRRFTWPFRQKDLRIKILSEKDEIEKFITWPVIQETMFVGNAPYIPDMYTYVKDNLEGVVEPLLGFPTLFDGNVSGNTIRNLYHLKRWEENSGKKINELSSIIEFGGGYGAMAQLCYQLGFDGEYTIFDLPEFSLLQEYYLTNTIGIENINLFTKWTNKIFEADLLIAICSLSEVKWLEKRNSFIYHTQTDHNLIIFQPIWDGIDNREFFRKMFSQDSKFFQDKLCANHWYCVG